MEIRFKVQVPIQLKEMTLIIILRDNPVLCSRNEIPEMQKYFIKSISLFQMKLQIIYKSHVIRNKKIKFLDENALNPLFCF